jgi:hypothetical protein
VYNLWRDDVSGRLLDDSMNDYYTYSKGTITIPERALPRISEF